MTSFATLAADCAGLLVRLSKSPTFAMSRGAKELFHTNFLAFILEFEAEAASPEEREVIAAIQSRLLELLFGKGNAPARVLAWRERKSIDLILCAAPAPRNNVPALNIGSPFQFIGRTPKAWKADVGVAAVVLEAKLKSLPDSEQLKRYAGVVGKGIDLEFADPIELQRDSPSGTRLWGSLALHGLSNENSDEDPTGSPVEFWAKDTPPQPSRDNTETKTNQVTDGGDRKGSRRIGGAKGKLRKVLLAPQDTVAAARDAGWKHLSWRELLAAFHSDDAPQGSGGLVVDLLEDYRSSTAMVLDVLEKVEEAIAAFAAPASSEQFSILAKATTDSAFRKKRIHDLVGKFAFDMLRFRLVEKIRPVPEALGFKFQSEAFMTNATPGAIFEYVLRNENEKAPRSVHIGIQLQGTVYRHFVAATHPADRDKRSLRDLAVSLGNPGDQNCWWHVDVSEFGLPNQKAEFGKYNENAFLYTAVDVSTLTFNGLQALLRSSTSRAKDALAACTAFVTGAKALHFVRGGTEANPKS